MEDAHDRLRRGHVIGVRFGQELHLRHRRSRHRRQEKQHAPGVVTGGAMEGWFGWTRGAVSFPGLARRVRGHLGPDWSPEEALLGWAASQGADDRVEGGRFRNRQVRDAWRRSIGSRWVPKADLHQGEKARDRIPVGGVSYYLVSTSARDVALSLSAGAPEVRWLLVRYD